MISASAKFFRDHHAAKYAAKPIANYTDQQYSLGKILTIWALAAVPMPILAFVVAPAVTTPATANPVLIVWYLMIVGMIWQFFLSVILLHQESDLRNWARIKQRIWLQAPQDPHTRKANAKLFLWLIPAFLFYLAVEVSELGTIVGELILIPFPKLQELPVLELADIASPELKGAWWLVGVAVVSCLFNYVLGEELLFRGVLLPRMRGVFGSWDWAANSVLFAVYHLHRPTQILGFILGGLAWTLPARRFQSIWFSIILHGFEGVFVLGMTIAVVSGTFSTS
jgi:membrane protease YdiL (CAAX protease family)